MSTFSCFVFGNPTNETGTANTWGTTNSKPHGPITVIDQSEIPSCSQVQFITLFSGGAQLCCAFHQPRQPARIWCKKTNFLSHTGTFWLFCNKFYCLESHAEHSWRWSKEMMLIKSCLDSISWDSLWLNQKLCLIWELYDWVWWFLEALAGSDHVNQTIVYYKHYDLHNLRTCFFDLVQVGYQYCKCSQQMN
jgi:hypothetical protein